MKMGNKIHTRIFGMVLLVILLLTLLAGGVFSVTSDWYIGQMTERSVVKITDMVAELEDKMSEQSLTSENWTEVMEEEYSRELLQAVKKASKLGEHTGKLLVYNSRFKQVYPNTSREMAPLTELSQAVTGLLERGELITERSRKLELGDTAWYIRLFKLDATHWSCRHSDLVCSGKYFPSDKAALQKSRRDRQGKL